MSHALRVGVADQIAYFRAYNTDGSAKTDLTSSTTGLTLSVFRVGASAVSIASLSAKAADNTAHADGAIRAVSGNLYTVDLPDAACADQVPSISVKGSYTGGVIEGPEHPLVGYNPASVAVGANTTTPPTVGAIADQVWDEARSGHVMAGTFGEKVNAELDSSARVKLAADQPDYVPATASALATAYALLQLTDSDVASILSTVETIETNIGTPSGSLASMVADVPTVAEFEARTIASASYRQNITLRGTSITEAKAFDLLLAASAGVTSQPSGTTEKFKFLDGNDAFTTTFDTNGNRTGVALA